jgi:ParB/RepB/Spo0J family partition protein
MEQLFEISLDQLRESPFNPRKTFVGIDALADDIKAVGRVLQPLLVRPHAPNILRPDHFEGYEVVFGHRRLRAAEAAGLETVPCMVRAMTDTEARRAQLSENIEREDVHPVEEAEGMRALIDHHGYTAERLASELGKSESHVYGRLQLLTACPKVREACLAGHITSTVALLIARLGTEARQLKALEYIAKDYRSALEDGGKQSFRRIQSLLSERFTLELKGAIFDPGDALLLPEAGACSDCPKRTGNSPVFEDIARAKVGHDKELDYGAHAGPNVCTDPDCFDAKKTAHLKARAAELQAKGKTVVEGNKARQAIDAQGKVKGAYIAVADAKSLIDKARQAAQKDSKIVPPLVVAIQDPRTGKVVDAVLRDELKKAGVKLKDEQKPSKGTSRSYEEERREREARAKVVNEQRIALLRQVHAAAAAAPRSIEDLRLVVDFALDQADCAGNSDLLEVAKLWDLDTVGRLKEAARTTMEADQLALLLLDVAMTLDIESTGWGRENDPVFLYAAARQYGIEPAGVQAEEEGSAA